MIEQTASMIRKRKQSLAIANQNLCIEKVAISNELCEK